ncbi:thiamine phosphate synthase [Sphingobium sufflavum]|nr:thiamine phosphate synthase [Sphingobium sufflavum]
MTDERVVEDRLLRAVRRLPRGSGVVFRHYGLNEPERRALFERVRAVAVRRGLMLLLAGDEALALAWGADGSHGRSEGRAGRLFRSAPVHGRAELRVAQRQGADMIFLSPLFATRSHPGSKVLGVARFSALARQAKVPVMALGGVARRHGALIRALGAAGYGAIDSLSR